MSWTRLTHLTVGAVLTLAGLLVLATTASVAAGVVLIAAGAAVGAQGLVARLRWGRLGWSLVTLTAVVGTVASLLVDRHGVQAQWDLYHLRGYPWSWLAHHAWYVTLGEPPTRQEWTFGLAHFAADLVFWGCVAVLVGTVIRLLTPRRALPRTATGKKRQGRPLGS